LQYIIGVDVGGTFTDCVIIDEDGLIHMGKSLSTPDDFSIGILNSIKVVGERLGHDLQEILKSTVLFFHCTTTAENALVTRTGAKVGLVTTKGFEDTLIIMRGKGRMVGLGETEITHPSKADKPEPIVPRYLIEGVSERTDYKGEVLVPLSKEDVKRALSRLMQNGIESLAICLLWSFKNSEHEKQIESIARETDTSLFVSASSELIPVIGEYERTSTTVLNAYLGPTVSRYILALERKLRENGFQHTLFIMQAYGGVLPSTRAAKNAVATIESGPAAGIIGSIFLAKTLGMKNLIAADMGGTTFKVGMIYEGAITYATEPLILRYHTIIPKVDIESIGAGGGSIAWIDASALLKVGPLSAGSKPGPVCYGLGGEEPTVTDANLLLGYLNPEYFLGGRMKLDQIKTSNSMRIKIAEPLSMDVDEAASAIYRIANAQMSDLIRRATVGRGHDPRDFVLFAYGGSGPVHANTLAQELDISTIIVPFTASVNGAFGAAISDVVHEYRLTDRMALPADPDRVNENFKRLEERSRSELRSEGFTEENTALIHSLEIRYQRQVHQLSLQIPHLPLALEDLQNVYREFEALYEKVYGKGSAYREAGAEIVNFSVTAFGKVGKPLINKYSAEDPDSSVALKGRREAFFDKSGFTTTHVYDFERLESGNKINGPAVIETPVTTIVVNPDYKAMLDPYRNVVITKGG
jgi:N-methylhydantoinase A